MTKEALKLALEALQKIYIAPEHEEYIRVWWPACEQAITAIKEALANEALDKMAENARELGLDYEPEQDWIERERAVGYREGHQNALKQMAQPEQEPVAWIDKMVIDVPNQLFYRAPQRTWVGLTDEEILLISADCASSHQHTDIHFARAIEAALKAKNT